MHSSHILGEVSVHSSYVWEGGYVQDISGEGSMPSSEGLGEGSLYSSDILGEGTVHSSEILVDVSVYFLHIFD